MKTQEIAIVALTLLGTSLIGCRDAQPLETKNIEQKADPTPTLTSTASSVATSSTESVGAPETKVQKVEPQPKVNAVEPFDEPSDESFEPDTDSLDRLTLVRFVTTSHVENREPMLVSSSFGTEEERIYAFIEAKNESEVDKTLSVHFIGPGQEVSGGIELEIPASVPRWRTWAYTRHARAPGLWRVEIRDEEGTLIGALPFEVEPAL
jgi:hypothetical protein